MNKLSATPQTPQTQPGIRQDYNYRAPGYTKEDEMNYQTLLNRYAARYEAIRRDKSLKAHERTQQGAFLRMLNEIQSDPDKHNISIADLSRVSPYSPMTTVTTSNGKQRSGVDRRHTILTDLHRLTMGSDMRDKVGESYWFDSIPGMIYSPHGGDDYNTPSARAYFGIKKGLKPGESSFLDSVRAASESLVHGASNSMVGGVGSWIQNRISRPVLHYMTSLFTDPKNASIKKSWEWGEREQDLFNAKATEGGNYAAYTMPLLTDKGKSDASLYKNLKRLTGTTGRIAGEAADIYAGGKVVSGGLKLLRGAGKAAQVANPLTNSAIKGKLTQIGAELKQFGRNPIKYVWNNPGKAFGAASNALYIMPAYEGIVSDPRASELNALELQRGVGNYDQTFVPGKDNKSISDLLISHPEIARQLTDYTTNARTGMTNPYAGSYEDNLAGWRNMRGVNGSKLGLSPIFKYYNTIDKQNRDIDERASKIDEIAARVADVTPKDGKTVSLAQRNLLKSRQRELNRATRDYSRKVNSYGNFRRDNYDNMLKGREIR